MKTILGLDVGTNSIGWALVTLNKESDEVSRIRLDSRIIPMSQDVISSFEKGQSVSQTAQRRLHRSLRCLRERQLLRRERLHRVLHLLGFLPMHYRQCIGWSKDNFQTYGKFLPETEPKFAWTKDSFGNPVFLFQNSFEEMRNDFQRNQPLLVIGNKKVPYDWTLYYLRKKALQESVTKEELAWIILQFNQKRGYYQLRGEEEEDTNKREYVLSQKVEAVTEDGTNKKNSGKKEYIVSLENGWSYRAAFWTYPDWVGEVKEFLVTENLDASAKVKIKKDGTQDRKLSILPSFEEIEKMSQADKDRIYKKIKVKTEKTIADTGKTVGSYIYDSLLAYPNQKIRGNLIRTIERKFYKQELAAILKKQQEYHLELRDEELYGKCVDELYPMNEAHRMSLANKDVSHLLVEDILFYQRPLKSKKTLIADCPYEVYSYTDRSTGERRQQSIKCVAKSNPFYQEFRIWKFLQTLKIYQRERIVGATAFDSLGQPLNGHVEIDVDVTDEFLPDKAAYSRLFAWLNQQKEIKQEVLLKEYFQIKKPRGKEISYPYRWNYVEDRTYPCNETRAMILSALKKNDLSVAFLEKERNEYLLWHLLYSVEDRAELKQALCSYAEKRNLKTELFVQAFIRFPSFKKEYGAYSEKAVKKLLQLMRMPPYWSEEQICINTKDRIRKIINGEYDDAIRNRVREKSISLTSLEHFCGLPDWLACYVVYDRYSELKQVDRWSKIEDLDHFIRSFKQHSLRNPIVEQVVLETLRTVRDIWKTYGRIDEIHVELGRDLKNPASKRQEFSKRAQENENTNLRIKALLLELKNDPDIQDVRPYSPMQQEILKLYEEGALSSIPDLPDDIAKISRMNQPSQSELVRYKLWLEQKYRSPYTGRIIPLAKLFTTAYQIEHVIPQSLYFDNSLSNKVICESEVNELKDNALAYNFINENKGRKIPLNLGGEVTIFMPEAYEKFVKEHYASNREKRKRLLMDTIPDTFIQRQLNDSRYISKLVKSLLSNIVREDDEVEAISTHVVTCTGGVTDRLKKDWGLNDVWNRIVYPRFERLNHMTGTDHFGHWENKEGKRIFQTSIPLELQKGFSKKRIDHRHHAMDALVIACATRNHVSYLNNEYAVGKDSKQKRYDLQRTLCDKSYAVDNRGNYKWIMKKPWPTFTQDAYQALQSVIVSFTQNLRVINKTVNRTEYYDQSGKKAFQKQLKNDHWAIRKALHKETVYGQVNLRLKKIVKLSSAIANPVCIVNKELKQKVFSLHREGMTDKQVVQFFKGLEYNWDGLNVENVEIYYFSKEYVASRKTLDTSFDRKKIEKITDTGIQQILLNYLEAKGGEVKIAFSPEGIAEMNCTIRLYNNGKYHQPILKVRCYETLGLKFPVGENGNKRNKFVETADGTNIFFAIYGNEQGERVYETIPFNVVIEREKQGDSPVPGSNEEGDKLKFCLSPNDLVYIPTEEERMEGEIKNLDVYRVYRMVSSTKKQCFFVRVNVANTIFYKYEYSALNKMEKSLEGEMIKEVCWKLEIDRLGNIKKIIK